MMGEERNRSAEETAEEATSRRPSEHEKEVADVTEERGRDDLGEWPRDVGQPPGAARIDEPEETG